MTPPMEMEAAGEATSAASPLGDNVRDAVVADANPRATRTISCPDRARADSALEGEVDERLGRRGREQGAQDEWLGAPRAR